MVRLLLAGSSIVVLLGVAHTIFTLQDLDNPRWFAPRDAEMLAAMQQSAAGLEPKINLWQAWLEFHFSHSLGLLMFGGAFLCVGIFHSPVFSRSPLLQVCSVLIPAITVILSLKFWFVNLAVFTRFSLACFILAKMMFYV